MLQLALALNLPDSIISRAENMKKRDKYNVRTLNKIANFFQLESYCELFPEKVIYGDLVRMRLQKVIHKKGKQLINDDGSIDKPYKIISITPLTEKETLLWQADKLPYLTIVE